MFGSGNTPGRQPKPATGGRRYAVHVRRSSGDTVIALRAIAGHRGTRATLGIGTRATLKVRASSQPAL